MPDINNSLALQVNPNPINLNQTLGTISNLQQAQALIGLRDIQTQQAQRQYNALQAAAEAYRGKSDPVGAYLSAGGDPTGAGQLQTVFAGQKAMAVTPGGLMPKDYSELSSAGKSQAETRKVGVDTVASGTDLGAKIAQGVMADPSNDSVWRNAVNQHYSTVGGPELERQQLLSVKDPSTRLQIAKAYGAQGVPPGTFGAPHNVSPTDAITTPGASYAVPQGVPLATNRPGGALPSSPRIMGDDEAVRQGLYSPTPEQIQRGVTGPASPNQQVANRFGAIQPAMTPGQAAESKSYGDQLAKVLPDLTEKANNSRQANFTLQQMMDESHTWNMGKGGTALMQAQQYLKPIANAFGSTAFDRPVADFESFQKNAGTLVRQAVKEVSPRAAVQEFQMIQNQLPSADMSRQGFNQIVNQFQAVNNFNIAKQQAAQAFRDHNGTMDGFETSWNKNITPTAFLVAGLPPDQLGALKANLQRTPEGRATLQSITKQLKWAHDYNLDEMVR